MVLPLNVIVIHSTQALNACPNRENPFEICPKTNQHLANAIGGKKKKKNIEVAANLTTLPAQAAPIGPTLLGSWVCSGTPQPRQQTMCSRALPACVITSWCQLDGGGWDPGMVWGEYDKEDDEDDEDPP